VGGGDRRRVRAVPHFCRPADRLGRRPPDRWVHAGLHDPQSAPISWTELGKNPCHLLPEAIRHASNGSTGYLPPFLALIFFGALALAKGHPAGWYNLAAAALFLVSVTFRAVDPQICGAFPLGTHFLWHTLNGLMLGVILAAVARYGGPRTIH
jgi:hypothetical protein